MYLTLLLLLSSVHASIASPLSEKTRPVHSYIPTADTSAKVARDVNVPFGKWLYERADTVFTALGAFGPQGLMGSINVNGQAVPATSNGNGDDDDAYIAPPVSENAQASIVPNAKVLEC